MNRIDDDLLLHEAVTAGLVWCLDTLVREEFLTTEQASRPWLALPDTSGQLERLAMAAAATLANDDETALMLYRPLCGARLVLWCLPHEVIHIAQMFRGDFVPGKGSHRWKGKDYPIINAADPSYFIDQPWEAEAKAKEGSLRAKFSRKFDLDLPP